MITLLAATILSVKFPGGTPNDFTLALAEGTQQNVVLSQGEAKSVPKAEFETADLGEMSRALRAQTLLSIMPGNDLVVSDQMLSRKLVAPLMFRGSGGGEAEAVTMEFRIEDVRSRVAAARGEAAQPNTLAISFIAPPSTAIKDGKITFKTEKSDAIQLAMLSGVLSKPVKHHWIYQDAPVYVQVKDMPELDFMKWVAKGVGARLISGAKDYSFELDPMEIRKRAIATISQEKGSGNRREDEAAAMQARNFRIACLNALAPAQITEALASQSGNTKIELTPRSPLTRLALNRIKEMEQAEQASSEGRNPRRAATGLMQRVDPNRSAFMMVDARFGVRMEIPVLDQNGRPAGVVRL